MKLKFLFPSCLLVTSLWGCSSAEEGPKKPDTGDQDPSPTDPDQETDDPDQETDDPVPQIVINEFMPSNATIVQDEGGGYGDWIELLNLSDAPVDLTGYFVSDNFNNPTKAELGAGLVIEAGGTLLLWADSDIDQGPAHLPFNLAKEGEEIMLTSPLGDLLDSIDYVDATTDSSFARVPDGVGEFVFCHLPTPNAPNDSGCAP